MTREEAIEILTKMKPAPCRGDGKSLTHLLMSLALGLAIKALEQQPCEDLINQRATTCRHGGHCEWVACDKCNHYEPDALSQQPCDDCISRQEAINCVTLNEFRYKMVEDIKTLPSVTPKEKTGKWITQWNAAHQMEYYICSECREEFSYDGETGIKMNDYNLCPNCGAKMQESEVNNG